MNRIAIDELKQQIPLLEYLQAHDWQQARPIGFGRLLGLCPLHADHKPSFLVDPNKNLFFCYGRRRGGDVIRFAELYHQVEFPHAVALWREWRGVAPLLLQAVGFYRMQLHRHGEAVAYLHQRGLRSPELIEHMRIGYAPGGCLRGWLTQLGYPLPALRRAGLVTAAGYDAYTRRIVFPLEGNLYGRSLSDSAPQRFCQQCSATAPSHRDAHWRMCRSIARLFAPTRARPVGHPRTARQTWYRTLGPRGFPRLPDNRPATFPAPAGRD